MWNYFMAGTREKLQIIEGTARDDIKFQYHNYDTLTLIIVFNVCFSCLNSGIRFH